MPRTVSHSMLQHLWGGGWGGRRGGGWRAESGAGQVEDDVVLVAGDDTDKVHPQGVQRAGILGHVKLVGNLLNAQGGETKIYVEVKCLILKTKKERKDQHLFVVGADEVENKAPVHERKQVIQEEGQTAI